MFLRNTVLGIIVGVAMLIGIQLLATTARADEIKLKDGRVFEEEIIEDNHAQKN